MKKVILTIVCAVILCGPLPVLAGEKVIPWQQTFDIKASGVSYWVVHIWKHRLDGKFAMGLVGDITQGVAGSGTTLTFDHATTTEEPTAAQIAGTAAFPKLNWHSGFAALAVDSGNTKYAYSLTTDVEPSNYWVGRFTSGVTDLEFTAELNGR